MFMFRKLASGRQSRHPFSHSYNKCGGKQNKQIRRLTHRFSKKMHDAYKRFRGCGDAHNEIIHRLCWLLFDSEFKLKMQKDGHWECIEILYAELGENPKMSKSMFIGQAVSVLCDKLWILNSMVCVVSLEKSEAIEFVSGLYISGNIEAARQCDKLINCR